METHTWTVAVAKAKLSEVIDQAPAQGPQTITRNGRQAVIVVAAQEWERKTKRVGTLADFLAAAPLKGAELEVRRSRHRLRPSGV
jgi:prevent-host-death family protein